MKITIICVASCFVVAFATFYCLRISVRPDKVFVDGYYIDTKEFYGD